MSYIRQTLVHRYKSCWFKTIYENTLNKNNNSNSYNNINNSYKFNKELSNVIF